MNIIGSFAFENNCNLEILNVPDRTVLEDGILGTTMLFLASLYDGDEYDDEKIYTMKRTLTLTRTSLFTRFAPHSSLVWT